MSDKFYSLMTILNKLDRGEKTTVNSLMDELEVKERTIYRYIQTLQVAKFPVYYDRKKGSYRFTEGYSLGRPNLSVEETLALALAKKMKWGSGLVSCRKPVFNSLHTFHNPIKSVEATPIHPYYQKSSANRSKIGSGLVFCNSKVK